MQTSMEKAKKYFKRFIHFVGGRDLWCSATGSFTLTAIALQLWFVIDWCAGTTFRPMSDWMLWACNLTMAMIITLPYVLSRRQWLGWTMLVIAVMIMEANLMYYRTYLQAIPPESYLLVGNLMDFTESVTESVRLLDIGFLIIICGDIFLTLRVSRKHKDAIAPHSKGRFCVATGIMALICSIGFIVRGGFYKAYDSLIQSCYYFTAGVPTYTIAGHIAHSLIDAYLAEKSWPEERIRAWIDNHNSHVGETPDSIVPRKNLVLIVCESLESWPIESKIGGKEITPYLNSLIADSSTLYVPNVLTQVGAGRSIDCQLLVGTGLMPMHNSVYSMKYPNNDYPSLNKAFAAVHPGSKSIIYTCDKPITWNQQAIARSFGYDALVDRSAWELDEMIGNPAKLSDGSFLRQSVARLGNDWPVNSIRMLTFITYSGHSPFRLPDNLRDPSFSVSGLPQRLSDYITMAHYTDSQLHTLIDYIKSRPDYDDTLIVIIGDHEALGNDRKGFADACSIVSRGRYTPLIILNSPVSGKIAKTVGQVDIYPTLLTLNGLGKYPWHGVGTNILSPAHPGAAFGSGGEGVVGAPVDAETASRLRLASDLSDAFIRRNFQIP